MKYNKNRNTAHRQPPTAIRIVAEEPMNDKKVILGCFLQNITRIRDEVDRATYALFCKISGRLGKVICIGCQNDILAHLKNHHAN